MTVKFVRYQISVPRRDETMRSASRKVRRCPDSVDGTISRSLDMSPARALLWSRRYIKTARRAG